MARKMPNSYRIYTIYPQLKLERMLFSTGYSGGIILNGRVVTIMERQLVFRWFDLNSLFLSISGGRLTLFITPDQPFRNLSASESVDWQTSCSSELQVDGFRGSKTGKRPVRSGGFRDFKPSLSLSSFFVANSCCLSFFFRTLGSLLFFGVSNQLLFSSKVISGRQTDRQTNWLTACSQLDRLDSWDRIFARTPYSASRGGGETESLES